MTVMAEIHHGAQSNYTPTTNTLQSKGLAPECEATGGSDGIEPVTVGLPHNCFSNIVALDEKTTHPDPLLVTRRQPLTPALSS